MGLVVVWGRAGERDRDPETFDGWGVRPGYSRPFRDEGATGTDLSRWPRKAGHHSVEASGDTGAGAVVVIRVVSRWVVQSVGAPHVLRGLG